MEERTPRAVEERTPREPDGLRPELPDPLIGEIDRERRDRRVLVLAAAIGIITGAAMGLVFITGAIADPIGHARGVFRHGAIVFVIGPPLASLAIGYAIYVVRRRRRRS